MVQLRNDKEKSKVMSYATELLSQITVKPDYSASWSSNVRFDMQVEVLTEKIDFGDLSERRGLSRMFVLHALISLKRQGKTTIEWNDLTAALTAEIQKYTSRPFFDYRICFPFHLTGSWITKKRKLNIMGLEFRKANWNQAVVMSGWKEFWEEANEHSVFRRREGIENILGWGLLFADVKARTEFEAFDVASRTFEVLRATINLVSDYQVVHHQFGSYTPFAKCLPSPVYGVFLTSGEYKAMYYTQEQYVYQNSDFDVESGMRVERLMQLVGKSSGQIQSVLVHLG